jgi:hypothetical protein
MISLNSGIGTPEFRGAKNILFSGIDKYFILVYFYSVTDYLVCTLMRPLKIK